MLILHLDFILHALHPSHHRVGPPVLATIVSVEAVLVLLYPLESSRQQSQGHYFLGIVLGLLLHGEDITNVLRFEVWNGKLHLIEEVWVPVWLRRNTVTDIPSVELDLVGGNLLGDG